MDTKDTDLVAVNVQDALLYPMPLIPTQPESLVQKSLYSTSTTPVLTYITQTTIEYPASSIQQPVFSNLLDNTQPECYNLPAAEHRQPSAAAALLLSGGEIGRRVSQETIARILAIEQEAAKVHDDAQLQAARLIEEAEQAASALREQTLAQARQEAEQIVTTGQEASEAERSRIVAQAEAEAQRMETLAADHFDQAVNFVLDQVAGRE